MNGEQEYLKALSQIRHAGIPKLPVRLLTGQTVTNTIALPNLVINHHMDEGYPLMTHRKMPFKSMCVELEGFLKGITDKRWYQERGCKFWDHWCAPYKVPKELGDKEKVQYMKDEPDLGPLAYSWGWRNFGADYPGGNGVDQIKNIEKSLSDAPYDRRMVCSAWNPAQMHLSALPACHMLWNVSVMGDTINLAWIQRSADMLLGVPNNIASYAMLLLLCAEFSGFKPGLLTGMFVDAHIYENHLDQVDEILKRESPKLPTVEFVNPVVSLTQWSHTDVKLVGYNPLEKISAEITV